jgi:hypothetical protein
MMMIVIKFLNVVPERGASLFFFASLETAGHRFTDGIRKWFFHNSKAQGKIFIYYRLLVMFIKSNSKSL